MTRTILLLDDNPADNFYSRCIIEEVEFFDHIVESLSARAAIEHLKAHPDQKIDLFLIDINMPAMDGFEFLNEVIDLPQIDSDTLNIVILSNSLNPDDRERAGRYPFVKRFINKPLSLKFLQQWVSQHSKQVP